VRVRFQNFVHVLGRRRRIKDLGAAGGPFKRILESKPPPAERVASSIPFHSFRTNVLMFVVANNAQILGTSCRILFRVIQFSPVLPGGKAWTSICGDDDDDDGESEKG
jgi:hypothetical protein